MANEMKTKSAKVKVWTCGGRLKQMSEPEEALEEMEDPPYCKESENLFFLFHFLSDSFIVGLPGWALVSP